MATDFVAKFAKLANPPPFVTLEFWNGLEYRNADMHVDSGNDPSTSWEHLVSFGTVTHEYTRQECVYQGSESLMQGQLVATIFSHPSESLVLTRDILVISCVSVEQAMCNGQLKWQSYQIIATHVVNNYCYLTTSSNIAEGPH